MRRLHGIAAALACAVVLASCSDPTGAGDEAARLTQHQRLWAARGVDSYRMTVRVHSAWLGGAAVVEVRGGTPVSVTPLPGGGLRSAEEFRHHDTVEELFAVVERALEQEAEHLEVRYSSSLGVPSSARIDLRSSWADDEHGFTVESFRVLR